MTFLPTTSPKSSSKTPWRFSTLLFAVVAWLLAGPICAAPARAAEEPPVHAVVSDEVLDLMGLDVTHTLVVGARLPLRPSEVFASLDAEDLRNGLQTLWEQNRQEILVPVQNRALPEALAFAITLGGPDDEPWYPSGLPWLGLSEVSLVVGVEQSAIFMEKEKEKRGLTFEDGSVKVGLSAAFVVGPRRYTVAVLVDRETELGGKVLEGVKSKVKKLRGTRNAPKEEEKSATAEKAPAKQEPKAEAKKDGKKDLTLTLALLADRITLGDVRALVQVLGGGSFLEELLDDDAISLEGVMAVLEIDLRKLASLEFPVKGLSVLGSTKLGGSGLDAYALMSLKLDDDDKWKPFVGFRLGAFVFKDVAPALDGTVIGDLTMPSVAITLAPRAMKIRSSDMNAAESAFYDPVRLPNPGVINPNYELKINEGLTLTGPLPLNFLSPAIKSALGMVASGDAQRAIVEGNPGIGFGIPFRGFPSLADMNLRVTLPELAPQNAPAWFVGGSLALEITGRPSLSLVGDITVDVKGDRLTFSVAGTLERDGAGVGVSLTGGLAAEKPWVAPFGVEWLTLNRVIATIGVNTMGNLSLGFRADLKVGDRVVDVAMLVAVNLATGVPTNFAIEGRTNLIALSDLAKLQQAMVQAAGRSAPRLSLAGLPAVELRDVYVRFAPQAEPALGIEAGFAIRAELWAQRDASGKLVKVAKVDVEAGPEGLNAYGYLSGFTVGPVSITNVEIGLTLTVETQRLSLDGTVTFGGFTRTVSIDLSADGVLGDFLAGRAAELKEKAAAAKAAVKDAVKNIAPVLRGKVKGLRQRLFGR